MGLVACGTPADGLDRGSLHDDRDMWCGAYEEEEYHISLQLPASFTVARIGSSQTYEFFRNDGIDAYINGDDTVSVRRTEGMLQLRPRIDNLGSINVICLIDFEPCY